MLRVLLFLLLAVLPSGACLWDRDTLQEEAKGKLDTVMAITGWFDRYPARYYEMRLDRVTKELASKPGSLDLYDDAGVACSRLGKHDESIAWMEKKKAVLDAKPAEDSKEDRYRYLSNLGTFHLIRWITRPEEVRSTDLADLKTSETFIAQALELNPNAHFGREKFQLMLIRWLLAPAPGEDSYGDLNFLNVDAMLRTNPAGVQIPRELNLEEARKGITGLIQLGAAWQSIDTFQALRLGLHSEKMAFLAHLAYLRQKELYDSGLRSLHPSETVREEIVPAFGGGFHGVDQVDRFFQKARAAAGSREKSWIAYQEGRFRQGMHPDTHSDFWKDWEEPEFPKIPGPTLIQRAERNPGMFLILFCAALMLGFVGTVVVVKKLAALLRRQKLRA